jgi:uncharacterized membrane protein
MLCLDGIYLTSLSKYFNKQVNEVQGSNISFRWIPTIICYIALVFGLNYFILSTDMSRNQKIINAILLGLVIYSVYETTTYAILKNWKLSSVVIDTLWGGILFGLTTFITTML